MWKFCYRVARRMKDEVVDGVEIKNRDDLCLGLLYLVSDKRTVRDSVVVRCSTIRCHAMRRRNVRCVVY